MFRISTKMSTNQEEKLWTRSFTLLWVTNFLMAIGFYFLLPTLPLYAMNVLNASESQVGYIVGIYTLAALAIRPVAGYALDSFGRKPVYLWALGFFTILMGTYYFATSLLYLLLVRFIHGLSWGVTTTGGGTIVADLVPPKRRGEGIGYFGLTMTLAMAIGPFLGLTIMGEDRFSALFLASGVSIATAFVLANFIRFPETPLIKRSLSFNAIFERKVFPISIVMFLTTFVYGGIISFIVIYGTQIGIKNGGLFFLVYAVALSLSRPYAGKMLDRQGPKVVTLIGFPLLILGFILLAASKNVALFSLAAIILGAGNGMVWPTLQTMIINMVEPHRRGVANSTYMSALDLGIGGGSIVLGWLAGFTSISIMYLLCGLLTIVPLLYFNFFVAKFYKDQVDSKEQK